MQPNGWVIGGVFYTPEQARAYFKQVAIIQAKKRFIQSGQARVDRHNRRYQSVI